MDRQVVVAQTAHMPDNIAEDSHSGPHQAPPEVAVSAQVVVQIHTGSRAAHFPQASVHDAGETDRNTQAWAYTGPPWVNRWASAEHRLRQSCPGGGTRRIVRRCCLRDLKKD